MICKNCGNDNPENNLYCEFCGEKIEYSRERVESELAEKANKQAEERLEKQLRDLLAVVIAVFLVVFTVRMMFSGDDWPRPDLSPSTTRDSPAAIQRYEHSLNERIPEKNVIKKLPIPEAQESD